MEESVEAKLLKCVGEIVRTNNEVEGTSIVMILSFRTDRPWQTVQTQIRLQSDQGLHCLPFRLHRLDSLLYGRST